MKVKNMDNEQLYGIHGLAAPIRHVVTPWVADDVSDVVYRVHLSLVSQSQHSALRPIDVFQLHVETDDVQGILTTAYAHGIVESYFPYLEPYLKWVGFRLDGYDVDDIMDALSERDEHGLLEGERRHLHKDGTPVWELVGHHEDGTTLKGHVTRVCFDPPDMIDITSVGSMQACGYALSWEPLFITGEGKTADLTLARKLAVWPTATDKQLLSPSVEITLVHRQQDTITEFKAAMFDLGFDLYSNF